MGRVPYLALFNQCQHLGKQKHVSESTRVTLFFLVVCIVTGQEEIFESLYLTIASGKTS